MIRIALLGMLMFLPQQSQRQVRSGATERARTLERRGTADSPFVVLVAPASDQKERDADEARREEVHARNESRIAAGTIVLAVVTALLAAGTAALAVYTYRLWSTTRDMAIDASQTGVEQARRMESSVQQATRAAAAMEAQVAKTDEIAERQLRAYVFPVEIEAPGNIAILWPVPVRYVLRVKNSGQTPAYNVLIRVGTATGPFDYTGEFSLSDAEKPTRLSLAPGTEASMEVIEVAASNAHLQEMRENLRTVFVWLRIDYVDAFGKSRFTLARYFRQKRGYALLGCEYGNDAN